ncbi:MAG: PH domain-containing protein [Patulibacter sp.]|nr:PH domain-containing protein [Patulibacter sp.]
MDLYDGETVLFEGHPSWRSALIFFVKGFVLAVIVGAALWFAVAHWAGVLGLVAVIALTIGLSVLIRSATDYAITNERLHIRRGIVSRNIQETRLGRVQNVTVNQTVWERLLRIGRAEFDTASDQENDFVFAGIADPDQVRAAVDKAHRLAEQQAATEQRASGQL